MSVLPKDANEYARHSTISLTMDRYAHVGLTDTAAAVGELPGLVKPSAGPGAAAGDAGGGPGMAGKGESGVQGADEPPGDETHNPLISQGVVGW